MFITYGFVCVSSAIGPFFAASAMPALSEQSCGQPLDTDKEEEELSMTAAPASNGVAHALFPSSFAISFVANFGADSGMVTAG